MAEPERFNLRPFLLRFGLGFAAFGTLFVGVGLAVAISTQHFLDQSVRATGEVIELAERRSNGETFYCPVVRFRAANGEPTQFQANWCSQPADHQVGDRVEVLYDPAHPDQAQIRAEVIPWLFAAIFGGIGSIFAIAGSGIAIASQFVEPLGIVFPPDPES